MRHLVLGSSGQIGAHLVKYLQDKGEQVTNMILSIKNGWI
jgi:nucleoside-diphosphate-sugar epimerase